MPKTPVSTPEDMRTGAEKRSDMLANKKSQEQAQLRQASSSDKGNSKYTYYKCIGFIMHCFKVPRAAKLAALKNAGLSTWNSRNLFRISLTTYYRLAWCCTDWFS